VGVPPFVCPEEKMGLTIEQAAEIVAAGGKWLDAHGPVDGWWNRIDLDRLNIANHINCVLGQVFADYVPHKDGGYSWAANYLLRGEHGLRIACELGFNYPYDLRDPEDFAWGCLALTEAWRHYITARRVSEQEPWITGRLVNDLAVSLGHLPQGEGVGWKPARTLAETEQVG